MWAWSVRQAFLFTQCWAMKGSFEEQFGYWCTTLHSSCWHQQVLGSSCLQVRWWNLVPPQNVQLTCRSKLGQATGQPLLSTKSSEAHCSWYRMIATNWPLSVNWTEMMTTFALSKFLWGLAHSFLSSSLSKKICLVQSVFASLYWPGIVTLHCRK